MPVYPSMDSSPLFSNVYLHYVPDEWFIRQIQPFCPEPTLKYLVYLKK